MYFKFVLDCTILAISMYIQGYLEEKLALESVQKLIKKTKGIIENNMKSIELVDSLVC